MHADLPSRTAWLCAVARARHQLLDGGRIFSDAMALPILGTEQAAALAARPHAGQNPIALAMRGPLAARSRIANDTLEAALATGTTQCVLLGAGLDTLALRNPQPQRLTIFEVDHPATQAWKRRLMAEAQLVPNGPTRWVPVDFERQPFVDALRSAGWDACQPTVVIWLGVTVYLTSEQVWHSLRQLGQNLSPGSVVVFDFMRRPALLNVPRRLLLAWLSRRYGRMGEPWRCLLDTRTLTSDLTALGFQRMEVFDPVQVARHWMSKAAQQTLPRRPGRGFSAVACAWR